MHLRLALQASQAGTWQSEVGTQRLLCDARTRVLLGLPAEGDISFADITGRLDDADRDRTLALFQQAIEPGGSDTWDVEFRVRHDDGTVVWIHGLGRVYRNEGGRALRLIGINLDITERKRAEEALRETTAKAEANARQLEARTAQLRRLASDLTLAEQRAREQLSRTLHDGVQQLMFGASLRIEQVITRQRAAGASEVDLGLLLRARNDIEEAIVGARSLAVELFPPVLSDRSLPEALVWLAGWMHQKYGLSVDIHVDAAVDPPSAEVRTLLFDSVRELLFNVVKHAGVAEADVVVTMEAEGLLRIRVTDQGRGLPTVRGQGDRTGPTGLGLVSIRERLTLLGGRVDVESLPGRGTTIELVAPLEEAARHLATASNAPGTNVGREPGSRRDALGVLVVDDHEFVREGLADLLADHAAFRVVGEARDGVEALALARSLQPDVVVMDVAMPRMDGVEATRRMRALLPSAYIIGLSAEPRTGARHPIEDAGADAFIEKGESSSHLVAILQQVAASRLTP